MFIDVWQDVGYEEVWVKKVWYFVYKVANSCFKLRDD